MESLRNVHPLDKHKKLTNMKTKISLFIVLVIGIFAFTQDRTISGVVTSSSDKQPLPGVMITVKGTNIGTQTDMNGHYSIKVPIGKEKLVFSFIGMKYKEVKIGKKDTINVALEEEAMALEEVVVTGYGVEKRKDMTGAVTEIRSSITGKVAGVHVSKPASIPKSDSESAIEDISDDSQTEESEIDINKGRVIEHKPQSNILTAGEWNDLKHWQFWQRLIQESQWREIQNRWQLFTNEKISVKVYDMNGKPANDLFVELWSSNTCKWKAKTDNLGSVILWKNLFRNGIENSSNDTFVIVKDNDGNELKKDKLVENKTLLTVNLNKEIPPKKLVDLMFVVDATGSMSDEINYLKSELEDIINRSKSSKEQEIIRTGLCFYRDHGDEYLVRNFDFKTDIKAVLKDLNNQYANGGGDFEEAVDEALAQTINNQSWSSNATARLLFLILDAPPHQDQQHVQLMQQNIKMAADKGIKVIPVVASGIDKNTEFLMRMIAQVTNGTYVFLTDDSGVGNSHLKPTIGNYQVEYLNNLILQLIKKYTSTSPNLSSGENE